MNILKLASNILIFVCLFTISLYSQNNLKKTSPKFDAKLAKKLGADEYGMKTYVFATLKTGKAKITDKKEIEKLQAGHLKNITRLEEEGKMVLAGPFFDGGNERGIFIFNVSTLDEAKKLIETDPAVKAGLFEFEMKLLYASAALLELLEIHKKIQKKSIVE